MIRLLEVVLFLMPFAGYGLWLWSGRRYTNQVLWGTLGAMFVLLMAAGWLELSGAVPPEMSYVPPHMEDGRIVPGQAVRRTSP
jgi:hypothetical protein